MSALDSFDLPALAISAIGAAEAVAGGGGPHATVGHRLLHAATRMLIGLEYVDDQRARVDLGDTCTHPEAYIRRTAWAPSSPTRGFSVVGFGPSAVRPAPPSCNHSRPGQTRPRTDMVGISYRQGPWAFAARSQLLTKAMEDILSPMCRDTRIPWSRSTSLPGRRGTA
jgi:hypothetical protein